MNKPVTKIQVKRPKKSTAAPEESPGTQTNANFDIARDERKVVAYVEIGPNLQKVLDKAITTAYQSEENIGNLMRYMGVDIKAMVASAVKLENVKKAASK